MTTRWWKALATVGSVAAIAAFAGAGNAFAYGSADQPIAQVEISANCDNPGFPLCQEVGLGGVWAWAELDTAGGSTDHGTMDYTVSFCDHTAAGDGPHGGGGFGHPGAGTWWTIASLADAPPGAFPFFDPGTYSGPLRVLDFGPGTPDDFVAVVPAMNGHYSNPGDWPAGAQFQTQVAP
jgi:hypothetical protein